MDGGNTNNDFHLLLTYLSAGQPCARGAQKCAGFEKQWEADCAPASHIFIDNQRTK
jgi:hypothetical protein